jgi:hypothetical protein
LIRSPIAAFLSFSIGFLGFGANTVNFDNVKPEMMPPYWTVASTNAGPPPRWEVMRDKSAPSHQTVFAQVSRAGGEYEFGLAVFDKVQCRDGDLSVKFKIVEGRQSKTAGLVWRYQDPRNYYLLHFSADQKNIAMFRVQDGQAHPIPVVGGKAGALGVSHDIRTGQWYVAKVSYRGTHFKVSFGNRALFEGVDDAIRNPGKTGLWTRGGTVSEFDDFRIDRKG